MSLKQIRWNDAKYFFPNEDLWDAEFIYFSWVETPSL